MGIIFYSMHTVTNFYALIIILMQSCSTHGIMIATVRDTAATGLSDDDLSVHVVTILNLGPGS